MLNKRIPQMFLCTRVIKMEEFLSEPRPRRRFLSCPVVAVRAFSGSTDPYSCSNTREINQTVAFTPVWQAGNDKSVS